MGDSFDIAESHRQDRLGAIQGLDLRLLIDRQDHGVVRRVEVETDHIVHFFDKEWVGGELETLAAVRLQGEELKDAMDRRLGQAVGLGGQPNAPVGGSGRLLFEGAAEQNGNLFVGDRARTAWTKFIVEALKAMLDKSLPPLAHCRLGPVQTQANLRVGDAFGRPQHQLGAGYKSMRKAAGSGKARQLTPLLRSQFKSRQGASQRHNPAYPE